MERYVSKQTRKSREAKPAPTAEKLAALEEQAKNELIKLDTLLSVTKMVAFGHHESGVVSDNTLIEALEILQREQEVRQKYKDTDTNKKRTGRLLRQKDRLLASCGGNEEYTEDGVVSFFIPSASGLQDEQYRTLVSNIMVFQFALRPEFPIELIEKEIATRVDEDLDVDGIQPFGVPTPIPPDFEIRDEDYSNLLRGFAQENNPDKSST